MQGLEERLRERLAPLGAVTKRMFGGTCFMVRGNMLVGTSKRGLLVRTGPPNDAAAAAQPAARPMEMRGKPMAGYWRVDTDGLSPEALEYWLALALAFNAALPEKPLKP